MLFAVIMPGGGDDCRPGTSCRSFQSLCIRPGKEAQELLQGGPGGHFPLMEDYVDCTSTSRQHLERSGGC